jgi:hypothetical protein
MEHRQHDRADRPDVASRTESHVHRKHLITIPAIAALVVGLSTVQAAPPPAAAAVVASTGFENGAIGSPYSLAQWAATGFSAPSGELTRTSVVGGSVNSGSKALRVTFPAGAYGTPVNTGAFARFDVAPERTYYLSQHVQFESGFSWGGELQAGKVGFGLLGGAGCSGGTTCDGTNGFTVRPIWDDGGVASLYVYHMGAGTQFGTEYPLVRPGGQRVAFVPGADYVNLTIRVTVNTVTNGSANPDGSVQVWHEGASVLFVDGLRFVTNDDLVDTAVLSTFPGGNEPEFAPEVTSYLRLDDVVVTNRSQDICAEIGTC